MPKHKKPPDGIDGPLEDIVREAEVLRQQGYMCFQRFTCEKCGTRQTMDEPAKFYTHGGCEECKHVTHLKQCGFMAIKAPGLHGVIRDALSRSREVQSE